MRTTLFSISLALIPFASGCGESDADARSMEISVLSAREVAIGNVPPEMGHAHIVLRVSMVNGDDVSHEIGPSAFWITSSDGLERPASTLLTAQLPDGCPSAALLTAGAPKQCDVAFELSLSLNLEQLRYRDSSASTAAPVPAVEYCERCGTNTCIDLARSLDHCGACDRKLSTSMHCVEGVPTCASADLIACPPLHPGADLLCETPEPMCGCGLPCEEHLTSCPENACYYGEALTSGDCNERCALYDLRCVNAIGYHSYESELTDCAATADSYSEVFCLCEE